MPSIHQYVQVKSVTWPSFYFIQPFHFTFRIIMTEREDNEEEELSQLRQEVKLTSSKLLDLTYNENQYVDTLEQYNQQAKTLILQDQLEQALVYLAEAQKLLQYGASCGRTIDRTLIILTLHNEACCYYKAADLATASRYIQGVIFNLKSHLDSVNSSPSNSSNSEHPRGSKNNQMAGVALEKKMELIHYYLKYCTVNSQAKNRKVALEAGKKTIQVLRALLPDLQEHKALLSDNTSQLDDLHQLIKNIKPFREEISITDLPKYLSLTRHYLKQWNQNKLVRKISYSLQKHISNYSISEVIELVPLDYQPQNTDNMPNCRSAMRQLLHFAMGYFTISTEYRLMADQLYKNEEEKYQSEQYIKANVYHLMAVLFIALYLPCELLFMKQIISSYEHHFRTNLMQNETNLEEAETLLEGLLLEQTSPAKKKNLNTALAAKLQKLRSKSKERKLVHTEYQDTEMYESKACYATNQTKVRTKRSTSKQKILNKLKKPEKVLNDSLFQSTSTKNIDNISKQNKPRAISKKRSTSNPKNLQPIQHKPRSTSKDSHTVKPLKMPIKVVEMAAVDRPKKNNKRFNDEYQLASVKCPTKKRSNSIASSADLSCTGRNTSKSKAETTKKSQKKKIEGRSKQKKLRDGTKDKETYSKHYYV